ncbi:hypothetical protein [Natrinema sp. CGMCC1.2065]|uniref:hypothetical protein n=1 Tax=Natrinema sp. CGMCC1.2065 TaxID=3445767 RepID=UPI003F4A6E7B
MWDLLLRLFSSSGSSNSGSAGTERDQWEWDRADEYPYDHYTDAVEDVKQLKREKRHDEVEDLLLWCIDYAEAEAEEEGFGGPPRAYYRHLAIVYRKDDRYEDEVEILERYASSTFDPHEKMLDRLERARELAGDS